MKISIFLIGAIIIYIILIYCLKNHYFLTISKNEIIKGNEIGDFIGGLLNPLFTLLSTISIIFLTYVIAKGDDVKAKNAIETQKRITLNRMRQAALENITQKTNLYVYELENLSIHEVKNKLQQQLLAGMIKREVNGVHKVTVWLVILSELENFSQLEYLFSGLFQREDFIRKHKEFIEITNKLCEEQTEFKFVKDETIGRYINTQKEFLMTIGNYIYSEF